MKRKLFLIILVLLAISWQRCEDEENPGPVDCSENPVVVNLKEVRDSNCGATDGSIEVSASGGSGNYQYSLDGGNAQGGSLFTNLGAGTYEIVVTDDNNCLETLEATIKNLDGMNISTETTSSGCGGSNGALTVTAFEGVPPYQFKLDDAAFAETNIFSGLQSGDYSLVVNDAAGCEVRQTVHVPSGVSYATSISPIIQNNCAVSGCHNGTQFPDFRVFKNIHDNAGQIKTLTGNRTMPQEGSLTQAQIDMIACWVDDGALQN